MLDTMTSWFSVNDALTRVAVMVCVVCVTGGQLGAVQGTLRIPQCSAQGWMELLEDEHKSTLMTCEGFSAQQTVKWRIVRNNAVVASYTCRELGSASWLNCNESSTDINVYRVTDTRSDLYIEMNLRELASNVRVDCYVDNNTSIATCRTNFIAPAVLYDCEVGMTTHRTLAGTCNFKYVYSSNGTYTCTWTLTSTERLDSPDIIIHGDITKIEQTPDYRLDYKGKCSFTRQIPGGHYTYTVRFFPGKPDHQYQGFVTVTAPSPTQCTADQCSRTAAYVAGGMVAAVVVIVAVVVVVFLVRRYLGRRKRRQPEEHPNTGLNVFGTVGQPAPSTSHRQGTVQSDQESAPGVN